MTSVAADTCVVWLVDQDFIPRYSTGALYCRAACAGDDPRSAVMWTALGILRVRAYAYVSVDFPYPRGLSAEVGSCTVRRFATVRLRPSTVFSL